MAKIFQNQSQNRHGQNISKIGATIDFIANIFQNRSQNQHGQNFPKSKPKIFGHKWKLEQGVCHIVALPFT